MYLFKRAILLLIITSSAYSQVRFHPEKSNLKITGTSSLHDWEMSVNEFDVIGVITDTQVQNLKAIIKAKSMESGKSIMNDKAYDAVKADDYPEIVFSAKTLKVNGNSISGEGSLMIGGEKREIDINATIVKSDTEMQLQGKVPLKMSDFNITPPTAMFGTLKTGDEVVIHYDIFLTK